MSDAFSKGVAMAIAVAPLFAACSGGGGGTPAPIAVPQCSGSSCGVQGPPSSTAANTSLCPADANIGSSTYLGGAGGGEIVSLNINATTMTYTLKWLESPVPLATGTVTPTRAGTTITGSVAHPPAGTLPTAAQPRCAFVLLPGSGTAPATNSTYSTAADFNQANPPMILIGFGVAGGGIPGATIQYSGLTIIPGVLQNIGQVPQRHFDFYPFLGFANTTTDLSKLPGTYNALVYHTVPSGNYAAKAIASNETFDANGACTSTSASGCMTTGNPWTASGNGYFNSTQAPQILPQTQLPLIGATGKSAVAHMVLGQLNGATVPVVVRTGNVNLGTPPLHTDAQVDDESGIAVLGLAQAIASGGIDGGYAGADSNFKYTATVIKGTTGTFVNPSTQQAETGFTLDYGQSTPGLLGVTTTDTSAPGFVIASGGLYAALVQGTVNGGITQSSAIAGQTPSAPYFGVGAQVSK